MDTKEGQKLMRAVEKGETDMEKLLRTGKIKHLKKFWQMDMPGDEAEWFVNCYRMRVSDECEWYGAEMDAVPQL